VTSTQRAVSHDEQAASSVTAKRQAHKRADGEGSIRQRGDGRWEARLFVGWLPDGKVDQRSVYGKTQQECRRKLTELRKQRETGTIIAADRAGATIAGFVERWLAATAASVRPSTHKRYAALLRVHVLPTLGKKRLDALRPSDIQALLAWLLTQSARGKHGALLTASTVHHVYVALHVALAAGVKWGDVARNVADVVDPPHVVKVETYTPTPIDVARLVVVAADDPIGALVAVAAFTGARQGELLGLQWPDIDFDRATLSIRRTLLPSTHGGVPAFGPPKTARSRRTVTLAPEAMAALRTQRGRQREQRLLLGPDYTDHSLVFATALGTPYLASNVHRSFKRLLTRAGLPESVRFHDLRHAAATNSLQADIPLKVVSERLGHSTLAITADLYTHRVASLEADAAEKLAALYRDAIPRASSE